MLAGEKHPYPISWGELERRAEEELEPSAAAYVYGGAGSEDTMRANLEAFRRWRIVPRLLRDVSRRDLSTSLLGTDLPAPVLLAPIGVQTLVHPDGELATARAAGSLGIGMVASTVTSHSLEQIAEAASDAPRWFQLYWPDDEELAASMVSRAERAGYRAIVLTVDNAIPGWKPRDLEQGYLPALDNIGVANYSEDPVFLAGLDKTPDDDPGVSIGRFLELFPHPGLTWEQVERLRAMTELPVVLKGILHPDDAREARERGVDGIVVSNHGGRQVDGAIPSLDALVPIADAVGDDMALLLDSGVRGGADVVKALALGADAVLMGRPYLWGLALGGEEGVEAVIRMLLAELDLTLALTGHTRPAEVGREALYAAAAP